MLLTIVYFIRCLYLFQWLNKKRSQVETYISSCIIACIITIANFANITDITNNLETQVYDIVYFVAIGSILFQLIMNIICVKMNWINRDSELFLPL